MAEHQAPRTTPPVALAYSRTPKPTVWPVVIGIIMIVWASLELLGSVIGMFAPFILNWVSRFMPPGQTTGMEALQDRIGWTMLSNALLIVVGVLLLISGIGLAKRKRRAVTLSITWAVLKILVVIFNSGVVYMIQKAQFEIMMQDPKVGGALGGGFSTVVSVLGTGIGLLWGWALPVFVLIWLRRRRIRAETATWETKAVEVGTPPDRSPTGAEHP